MNYIFAALIVLCSVILPSYAQDEYEERFYFSYFGSTVELKIDRLYIYKDESLIIIGSGFYLHVIGDNHQELIHADWREGDQIYVQLKSRRGKKYVYEISNRDRNSLVRVVHMYDPEFDL